MTDVESLRATARDRLAAVGWSQAEWGRRCGIDPKTISEILTGKTQSPEYKTIATLESVLAAEERRRGIERDGSIGERPVNVTETITRSDESRSASGDQPNALFNWLSQAAKDGYTEAEIAEIEAKALAVALQAAREIRAARPLK
jgi:transcriptional regulator with XRE-family HTH domain